MYNVVIFLAVLLAAYMLLVALSETISLCEQYSEWSTNRRRKRYRVPAYADMERRWTQHQNREQLWQEVQK